MPKMSEDLVHGCGQRFKYPGAYARHGMKCDGQPPARSRIEGGSGSSASSEGAKEEPRPAVATRTRAASAKRTTRRAKKPARSSVSRRKTAPRPAKKATRGRAVGSVHIDGRRLATMRVKDALSGGEPNGHAAIRPADFLKALYAERDKINDAIRAVEALA